MPDGTTYFTRKYRVLKRLLILSLGNTSSLTLCSQRLMRRQVVLAVGAY